MSKMSVGTLFPFLASVLPFAIDDDWVVVDRFRVRPKHEGIGKIAGLAGDKSRLERGELKTSASRDGTLSMTFMSTETCL
jgi:hypothetical protein